MHPWTSRRIPLYLLLTVAWAPVAARAGTCEALTSFSFPNATITAVESVGAGSYKAPDTITYAGLPAFCRVAATLTPSADSSIRVEVWMPVGAAWNGRYEGTGNGGYAGSILYGHLALGLQHGFAVANTDMGTAPATALNGDALVGHPEKWKDWGYRATHEMTVFSKSLVEAFYGHGPRYSYFSGCSTGGQQALQEAQSFPDDYDGILGGAPAHDRTHGHAVVVWQYGAIHPMNPFEPGGGAMPAGKLTLLKNAVVAACGTLDGGLESDPFLADPRDCHFDPGSLQCTGADAPDCLTAAQVQAMRYYYGDLRNLQTGAFISHGFMHGSEFPSVGALGLGYEAVVPEPGFDSLFKWVFGASWNWATFNFASDMDTVDAALAGILNATNPDLSAFRRHGGKLILFHGWADPLIPSQNTIRYYERVVAAQNPGTSHGKGKHLGALKSTQEFARLFMAPGVGHCTGGDGPDSFGGAYQAAPPAFDAEHDLVIALMDWVEHGKAPDQVVATRYNVDGNATSGVSYQRPLCAYPKIARYSGSGATTFADSFQCVDDGRGLDLDQ